MFIAQVNYHMSESDFDFESTALQECRNKALELGYPTAKGIKISSDPELIIQREWPTEALATEYGNFLSGKFPSATVTVFEESSTTP